jgi:hypothetical protein
MPERVVEVNWYANTTDPAMIAENSTPAAMKASTAASATPVSSDRNDRIDVTIRVSLVRNMCLPPPPPA